MITISTMKGTLLTFTLILSSTFVLFGQRTITGQLLDKASSAPVKDVTVSLKNTSIETKTDAMGFFQLSIGTVDTLLIKSDFYSPIETRIPLDANNFTILLTKEKTTAPVELFTVVEEAATFPGGFPKFYNYVSQNLNYPKSAKKARIAGKVFVEFVINRDGTIDSESVRAMPVEEVEKFSTRARSEIISHAECEMEAIRIIKNSPNWNPGLQKGKPVRQRMVVPITFR